MTNDKQRKRLVELVGQSSIYNLQAQPLLVEQIADHILADGWMRPPCKVGQTAFFLIEDKVTGERYISPEPITDVCTKGFYTSGHDDSDENGDLWLWSDVGETVFLTKEEAEEALKARGEDD